MIGPPPRKPAAPPGFEAYHQGLGPQLDAAVAERIAEILAPLPWSDRPALQSALEGGKKLRGSLLCLVCEAFGGARGDALPRAVAVELIQTASLVHDDVVDGDRVRRGRPSVWTLTGARRAVLLGDVLFATAIEAMSRLGPEDAAVISRAIARIAEGACSELLEPASLADAVEADGFPAGVYERIIRLKTGILFGTACRLGAAAAGADPGLSARAERYGLLLGEAYQIADDLEDLRRLLSGGGTAPRQVSPLAPALLCFAPETRARVLDLLRGVPLPEPEVRGLLAAAGKHLGEAIEGRLRQASRALGAGLPPGASARLRRAPREVIRLFREGETTRGGH
jgi:hypothetical protein